MANLVEITKTETINIRLGAIQTSTQENLQGVVFIKAQNLKTGELEQFATTYDRAKQFAHESLVNTANIGKDFEVVVRVIPKADENTRPAYKTRKNVEIDGITYNAGDLVPYRNLDGFKVIELCAIPYKESVKDIFKDMTGEEYDPTNAEHRLLYLDIRKSM